MWAWRLKRWIGSWRLPDTFFLPAQIVAWAAILLTIVKALPFMKDYAPTEWSSSEVIIGLLAILVLGTVHLRKDIKADTTQILEKLEGPEFRRFNSSEEQIFHIARQIHKAEDSVCDVTWVDYLSPERSSPARESAQRALDDAVIAFSAHKPYREIFIFDGIPDAARTIRLSTLGKRTEPRESGYYCAFMKSSRMPRLQLSSTTKWCCAVLKWMWGMFAAQYATKPSQDCFGRIMRGYGAPQQFSRMKWAAMTQCCKSC